MSRGRASNVGRYNAPAQMARAPERNHSARPVAQEIVGLAVLTWPVADQDLFGGLASDCDSPRITLRSGTSRAQ